MDIGRDSGRRNKIGIMGGTFDPIHYGHLVAAEVARTELDLDRVIFMPAGRPPHKQLQKVTDSEHRYAMAALAVSSNPSFEVSRIEVDKAELTYTIDTVKELISVYGEDTILELMTWFKVQELLTLCKFIAVTRPGFDKEELEQKIADITSNYNGDISCIEVPMLDISSTDIRKRVRLRKPIKYLLPESVEEYIYKNGLYRE
jgi:nicotinate-nucleotide adenylyltransferase